MMSVAKTILGAWGIYAYLHCNAARESGHARLNFWQIMVKHTHLCRVEMIDSLLSKIPGYSAIPVHKREGLVCKHDRQAKQEGEKKTQGTPSC